MPIQVNVANGSITPAGSSLTAGVTFQWLNLGTQVVNLGSCGNWCTQDNFQVQPNGGTTQATVLANPNFNPWAFRDSGWNAPGLPPFRVPDGPRPRKKKWPSARTLARKTLISHHA